MARLFLYSLCSIALLMQGCASKLPWNNTAVFRKVEQNLSTAERQHLGQTTVIAVHADTGHDLGGYQSTNSISPKTYEAIMGAASGAYLGFFAGAPFYALGGISAGSFYGIIALGAAGGSVISAATATSEKDLQNAADSCRDVIKNINPPAYLPGVIAKRLGDPTYFILKNPAQINSPQSTYASLVESGTDAVLEITVKRIALSHYLNGFYNKDVAQVVVHTRLRRAKDGAVISEASYTYRSPAGKELNFWEWSEHNATKFHHELVFALDTLAAAIAQDLTTQTDRPKPLFGNKGFVLMELP